MNKKRFPEYQISQDAFKAWLGSNFRTVVGRAVKACECPLVNYIKTIEPPTPEWDDIHTGGHDVFVMHKGFSLPEWARLFVMEVDSHNNYGSPITGQAALSFLETVDGEH